MSIFSISCVFSIAYIFKHEFLKRLEKSLAYGLMGWYSFTILELGKSFSNEHQLPL